MDEVFSILCPNIIFYLATSKLIKFDEKLIGFVMKNHNVNPNVNDDKEDKAKINWPHFVLFEEQFCPHFRLIFTRDIVILQLNGC